MSEFKDFIIHKGKHYGGYLINLLGFKFPLHPFPYFYDKKFKQKVSIIFKDASYVIEDDDKYDINKLFGLGFGWNHHDNSVRFGWLWNDVKKYVEVYYYWYDEKIRQYERVQYSFYEGIEYKFEIVLNDNNWAMMNIYDFRDKVIGSKIIRNIDVKKFGAHLYPYFGGNKTAPKDIVISIKKLE